MQSNEGLEYYFIDTIRNDHTMKTFYYVIHQYPDGHRNAVSQPFTNYEDAQTLMEELNEDLASTFYKNHIRDEIE